VLALDDLDKERGARIFDSLDAGVALETVGVGGTAAVPLTVASLTLVVIGGCGSEDAGLLLLCK
jgi:hypothetical protein